MSAVAVSHTEGIAPAPQPIRKAARFTVDGSEALERELARICDEVMAAVQRIVPGRKLQTVMLGGGYGRGEGGVLGTEAGDRPYNDLEFYVCLRGNRFLSRRRFQPALDARAEELSRHAGVEVEFKIISLAQLRRAPASMFYYDLVAGHRWLLGDESLLAGCDHHRQARLIPASEATRLLMNRCTGLLLAREKLHSVRFSDDDADFVGRNLAKAQLAFGDAALTLAGQYHWSCRERQRRLAAWEASCSLPWLAAVQRHHREGVGFKLHPCRSAATSEQLQNQWDELAALGLSVWLWVESHRLGGNFRSAWEYACSSLNKCPETKRWRNFLVNAQVFGPAALLHCRSCRHPRERLFDALALLLWGSCGPGSTSLLTVQAALKTGAELRSQLAAAYVSLWRKVR